MDGVRVVVPGTSANLGPGFDAVGLAMSMWLTVDAWAAEAFSIQARGRNADVCGDVADSLILETYRGVLERAGLEVRPLRLKLENEIPLGMGCGSSAAALCVGVALADWFGELGLGDAGIVAEASRLEGHPDNVAACWLGGFTVSAQVGDAVETATFGADLKWEILLAVQASSLATKKARALLPESYAKSDAVFNVQRVVLLTAAFALGRKDLLRAGMEDRLHQPYRLKACPLLKALLPLAEEKGFAGVALSGAGPSVLMFVEDAAAAEARVRELVGPDVEVMRLRVAGGACRSRI